MLRLLLTFLLSTRLHSCRLAPGSSICLLDTSRTEVGHMPRFQGKVSKRLATAGAFQMAVLSPYFDTGLTVVRDFWLAFEQYSSQELYSRT